MAVDSASGIETDTPILDRNAATAQAGYLEL